VFTWEGARTIHRRRWSTNIVITWGSRHGFRLKNYFVGKSR
jgi:hypothetical protein